LRLNKRLTTEERSEAEEDILLTDGPEWRRYWLAPLLSSVPCSLMGRSVLAGGVTGGSARLRIRLAPAVSRARRHSTPSSSQKTATR
jgi:hypothetical protein